MPDTPVMLWTTSLLVPNRGKFERVQLQSQAPGRSPASVHRLTRAAFVPVIKLSATSIWITLMLAGDTNSIAGLSAGPKFVPCTVQAVQQRYVCPGAKLL